MPQYRYVIVANDGSSHDVSRNDLFVTERPGSDHRDLPKLLREGWLPVRETTMGQCEWTETRDVYRLYAAVLVLLQKDSDLSADKH
jgi:hypothetical protein